MSPSGLVLRRRAPGRDPGSCAVTSCVGPGRRALAERGARRREHGDNLEQSVATRSRAHARPARRPPQPTPDDMDPAARRVRGSVVDRCRGGHPAAVVASPSADGPARGCLRRDPGGGGHSRPLAEPPAGTRAVMPWRPGRRRRTSHRRGARGGCNPANATPGAAGNAEVVARPYPWSGASSLPGVTCRRAGRCRRS